MGGQRDREKKRVIVLSSGGPIENRPTHERISVVGGRNFSPLFFWFFLFPMLQSVDVLRTSEASVGI